jgi:hypothetical protein
MQGAASASGRFKKSRLPHQTDDHRPPDNKLCRLPAQLHRVHSPLLQASVVIILITRHSLKTNVPCTTTTTVHLTR